MKNTDDYEVKKARLSSGQNEKLLEIGEVSGKGLGSSSDPSFFSVLTAQEPIAGNLCVRACFKNHSRHLHAPVCVIFVPNSGYIARYAPLVWHKSPTNWGAHLTESMHLELPDCSFAAFFVRLKTQLKEEVIDYFALLYQKVSNKHWFYQLWIRRIHGELIQHLLLILLVF